MGERDRSRGEGLGGWGRDGLRRKGRSLVRGTRVEGRECLSGSNSVRVGTQPRGLLSSLLEHTAHTHTHTAATHCHCLQSECRGVCPDQCPGEHGCG